ncbi:PQQ-binding-like beta-propeller repeat protein [Sneathiella sp. P13V-1]|uniref:outer membrane protein assembly factor BamB family protein n=1 Tax=Sneathiella sp. P13V-1 TaxID=2697366 RepID=UPI00187BB925|nr:PQQ-binding-like beta-propeller repeat protein [Sneathiella sp. P13V-1]MBE7636986.1 PQQ-binding-like beta-propeller repeat protein [Sneathiella sp. P13V-1]
MKRSIRTFGKWVALCGAISLVSACDSLPNWFGDSEAPPLPGERISILALEKSLEPDEGLADVTVRLPAPYANENWPQSGGAANNAMHHLLADGPLEEVWSRNVGEGNSETIRIPTRPIIADGRLFVMDARSRVRAYEAATGRYLWGVNLTPRGEESGTVGGGISAGYNRLVAATSYGEVFVLDPATGRQYWKEDVGSPVRAAPTIAEDAVFVITVDSRVIALELEDGENRWDYEGGIETTGLLGAASAAVDNGLVIVPFSTGELYALRADNGQQAWSDQLQKKRRYSSLTSLADINANPVIDRGLAIAASFSGHMVGIDTRSGNRKWDQEISTLQTPWVAGDFIFAVTTDGELVCLSRQTGLIRWVRSLGKYEDPEDKSGLIVWNGPVLVSDRLILTNNYGIAVSVSPYDGEILGKLELDDPVSIPPVVAGGILYILTDDARLVALR